MKPVQQNRKSLGGFLTTMVAATSSKRVASVIDKGRYVTETTGAGALESWHTWCQ